MPCNSDYLDPTMMEEQLQRTAQLLVYVLRQLDWPIGAELIREADNPYAEEVGQVERLCSTLSGLSKDDFERIVYNARSKTSRDLADWWEEHEAADREREEQERADTRREQARQSALAKLTPEEREALGL